MSHFKNLIKQYVAEAVEELINEGLLDNFKTTLQNRAGLPDSEKAARDKQIDDNWKQRVEKKQKSEKMVKDINTPPQMKFDFYKDLTK